jgi:hypothetical protein
MLIMLAFSKLGDICTFVEHGGNSSRPIAEKNMVCQGSNLGSNNVIVRIWSRKRKDILPLFKYSTTIQVFYHWTIKVRYCGGLHLVINTYFILYICLANYGASEAVYLCVVVEEIHEYFWVKNAPIVLGKKISCSLTLIAFAYFGSLHMVTKT